METLILSGLPQAVPFVPYVGVTLTEAKSERGAGYIEQRQDIQNHVQTLHAGALFTLAETVAGAAVTATFFDQITKVKIIASGARVTYHLPARGKICATSALSQNPKDIVATLDADGVVTFSGTATLADEQDACVATIEFDFHASRKAG